MLHTVQYVALSARHYCNTYVLSVGSGMLPSQSTGDRQYVASMFAQPIVRC